MRELILSIPIVTGIWLLIKWAMRSKKEAKKYRAKVRKFYHDEQGYWDYIEEDDTEKFYNK